MARISVTIFCISFIVFYSCRNNKQATVDTVGQKVNYKNCSLLIYSPYNCYYEIMFNNEGIGNLKATNRKYRNSDSHESDSLISSNSFKVESKSDMQKISKLIEQIEASDPLHSNPMFESYRFEFIIDQKRYIDVYGENKQVNDILKILLNYISKNEDDKCGILKLFKQTLKVDKSRISDAAY